MADALLDDLRALADRLAWLESDWDARSGPNAAGRRDAYDYAEAMVRSLIDYHEAEPTDAEREELAEVIGQHVRGDWSDRTYSCQGCTARYEEAAQGRFDALGREPTREEWMEFRKGYSALSRPGWSLDDYHAHAADVILAAGWRR